MLLVAAAGPLVAEGALGGVLRLGALVAGGDNVVLRQQFREGFLPFEILLDD
jgi:hypothetical protein